MCGEASDEEKAREEKVMKISVVVPALNEEKYIHKLLRSLARQNPRPFEVIVVDGCSRDRTAEIARELGAKVIVKPSNIAEARNIGAWASSGDRIFFLDADTILPPGFMEELQKLGPVDCAVFRPEPLENCFIARFGYIAGWLFCRLKLANPCYMGLLVRKDIFKAVGGFRPDLNYSEDLDLLRKIAKRTKIRYPKHMYVLNSTRRWIKDGRMILSETLKIIWRIIEYLITKKSRGRYPIYR